MGNLQNNQTKDQVVTVIHKMKNENQLFGMDSILFTFLMLEKHHFVHFR